MAPSARQGVLFAAEEKPVSAEGIVPINGRSRIETRSGYCVVSVSGLTLAHYAVGDRMAEAHAMVSLVEQGWALQVEGSRSRPRSASMCGPCGATSGAWSPVAWPRWVDALAIRRAPHGLPGRAPSS